MAKQVAPIPEAVYTKLSPEPAPWADCSEEPWQMSRTHALTKVERVGMSCSTVATVAVIGAIGDELFYRWG